MLISIACNYLFGILIDRFHGKWKAGPVMAGAVIFNISLLGFYKYANFLAENLNGLLHIAGIGPLAFAPVHLPIGISFYTFHTMSYLIDVHRRIVKVQKNPADFALYVSLFPQLVSGTDHPLSRRSGPNRLPFAEPGWICDWNKAIYYRSRKEDVDSKHAGPDRRPDFFPSLRYPFDGTGMAGNHMLHAPNLF